MTITGGEEFKVQAAKARKNPEIIIGTPGRTIDHINRKLIRLNHISYLVLDEADEMLKMGFKEDIETILEGANTDRQTVMFSATMPKTIIGICGNARCGKDTMAELIQEVLADINVKSKKIAVHPEK